MISRRSVTPAFGTAAVGVSAGAELVLRFLASVGRPAETEQYLELFKSDRPESFAVIHVSAPVIEHAFDALIGALHFLSQLGLCPIVTFGAVTARGARRAADRVRLALGNDVPAQIASRDDIAELTRNDIIALLPLADDNDSVEADPDAAADRRFTTLTDVVSQVAAKKLIFVGRRSGLQPRGGRVISMIDIVSEAPQLAPQLPEPQRKLLRQIDRAFSTVNHPFTVSVTSPMDLLRELFTVKGAGTLVRRAAAIDVHRDWTSIDRARLAALVSTAFKKPLASHFFDHDLLVAYIADDYRGAAVVTKSPLGSYLSKFAVDTVARGEGIGRDLWRALSANHSELFWKSRSENPITAWYREQCDGLHRTTLSGTPWHILWRGIPPTKIPEIIAYCSDLPPDFV
jgi:ribosomal protein S18 acetylase RimI-like enzyme